MNTNNLFINNILKTTKMMNKELLNGVIDALIDFVGACANDVCNDSENEYTVFAKWER